MVALISIVGLLGLPVGAYLLSLCFRGGVSIWGWAWMAVYVLFDLAAFFFQNEPRRAKYCFGIGLALLAAIVGVRLSKTKPVPAGQIVRLPAGTPGPVVDRLVDERDLGMMLFVAMADFGGVRKDDYTRSKAYLRAAWKMMNLNTDYAPIPSPIPSNLLSLTSPTAIHTLVLNPAPEGQRARRSIVYLHGTGGSQKLPCYLLAQRMPDATILCPSVGLGGEWANERGEATFHAVLDYATPRSSAVYVVGQGYGGRGALHLLNRSLLGHIAGIVLLSGFDENYFDAVRRSDIPILILRGEEDARTPAFRVEGLAHLDRVHNVEVAGGHYILYENEDAVLEEIDNFCGAH